MSFSIDVPAAQAIAFEHAVTAAQVSGPDDQQASPLAAWGKAMLRQCAAQLSGPLYIRGSVSGHATTPDSSAPEFLSVAVYAADPPAESKP